MTLSIKAKNELSNSKSSLVIPVIGIGVIFIALNLQLFFDLVIMPKFLFELYEPSAATKEDAQVLTTISQNFIRALYLLVFMVVLLFAGVYSDHLQTRLGNRIPLILFGLFLIMLSYIIGSITIPIIRPFFLFDLTFTIILSFSLLYTLIAIGAGCVWASGYALVVDLFKPEERHWVGMGIALIGSIGPLIGIGLTNSELNLLGFVINFFAIESKFSFFMLIFGILILILGLIALILIPMKNPSILPITSIREEILNTPKYMFYRYNDSLNNKIQNNQKQIRAGNHTFLFLFVYQIFSGAAIFVILTNVPIFLDSLNNSNINVGMTSDVAFIIMGLFGAILAGPSGILIKTLGKTRAAMVGAMAFGIASFLLAQEFMWTFNGFLVILILFGGSSVLISTLTIALPADHVPLLKAGHFMGIFIIAFSLASPAMGFTSTIIAFIVRDDLFLTLKILFNFVFLIEILVVILLINLYSREKQFSIKTKLRIEAETSQSTQGTS